MKTTTNTTRSMLWGSEWDLKLDRYVIVPLAQEFPLRAGLNIYDIDYATLMMNGTTADATLFEARQCAIGSTVKRWSVYAVRLTRTGVIDAIELMAQVERIGPSMRWASDTEIRNAAAA